MQTLLKNVMYIVNPAKLIRKLTNLKALSDSSKFGLFLMCWSSIYKIVLCMIRRSGSSDEVAAPVAGFLSALSLFIEPKSRRMLIAVLILSRFIDTSIRILEEKGVVPKTEQTKDLLLWVLSNSAL